jgi:hypothetical protein
MFARIAAALTLSLAIVTPQVGNDDPALQVLRGAIDIHVHADPDNVPRSLDGIEAATMARSKGCARSC